MKQPSLPSMDFEAFASRLAEESDRACGVLGAALLDAGLEDLFRRRLHGPSRPLGSFSARIRLAYSLCWIDADTASDLNTIRSIRNDFAHSFDHALAFSDYSISGRCATLLSATSHLDGIAECAKHNPNFSTAVFDRMRSVFSMPRWRFQIAVESISQLLRDLPSTPTSYSGPSLRSEAFAASAATRFRAQGSGTLKPPGDD